MKKITIQDFIEQTGAELVIGNKNEILENFKKDTREIEKGDVYVGIKGENTDGSIFFEQALKNGAKVCILNNIEIPQGTIQKYKDRTIVKTNDTIESLQKIAEYKRKLYNIPVVGITGSVGKTSTKDLIASVMSKKFKNLKTNGNYNNHIGVPLTILRLEDHTSAVIEMGMNHLGEISKVTKIAKPTMSVITNVGTAHIGNLGSRENILKAKMEILEGMEEGNAIIINNDNDMLHDWYLKNRKDKNIITYGIENESNIMAKNIVSLENASEFDVEIRGTNYHARVNVRR
ncbi:MAG: UDP-N-acetylmuramoyl-tripeptide--D-alanyl-D-alanine ligase [Clostridia bacterium]|nr:UDP-N-acetylmuramoyl-tripeptide--D-alanyl-D-alanine ligase [Clostridia bacterium]